MKKTYTFDHVGGHPLIDFVNTKMMPEGQLVDLLTNNQDVIDWMVDVGMIEADSVQFSVRDEPNLLGQVRAFRLQMRDMLAAIVTGQTVSVEMIEEINSQLVHWRGQPQLVKADGAYVSQFGYELTQSSQLLGRLAESAAQFVTVVDFRYVKQCDKSTCIRFFLDTSRNHSRRWCSMEGCGNRNKARAHYARKKEVGGG